MILEFSLGAGLMVCVYECRGKDSCVVSISFHREGPAQFLFWLAAADIIVGLLPVCGLASEPTLSASRPTPSPVASQRSIIFTGRE